MDTNAAMESLLVKLVAVGRSNNCEFHVEIKAEFRDIRGAGHLVWSVRVIEAVVGHQFLVAASESLQAAIEAAIAKIQATCNAWNYNCPESVSA